MAKTTSIPRLSIVVPVGNDMEAFEETLLSVLENRPAGSEILVAHDGRYDDPFELADEVRFVTATSDSLVDLVSQSAEQARGRFVHVLASGLIATRDWADAALAQFERQQTAVVAPVIRDGDTVVAAGWGDTPGRLFQPLAAGGASIDRSVANRVLGAYLQASFWRRDVLRSVITAFASPDMTAANYAYGRLLIAGGWSCSLATDCQLVTRNRTDFSGQSGYARGQQLWAIKKSIDPSTRRVSWLKLLGQIFRPAAFAETLGQINGPAAVAKINGRLSIEKVASLSDRPAVVKMPHRGKRKKTRRAA